MSDSTRNLIDNINQSNLIHAIIEALNIASDHPDRSLDPHHQSTLLKYVSDYFVALEQKNNTRDRDGGAK